MQAFSKKVINCVDDLTKTFTKEYMTEYSEYLLSKNTPFSYLLIDMDNFKIINDSYGHNAGDAVLKAVVERIQDVAGAWGILGRYAGDKFIFVMSDCIEYQTVWERSRAILQAINSISLPDYKGLYLTATIGLARFPEDAASFSDISQMAEKALYRGKIKGRNCFIIYLADKHSGIVIEDKKEERISSAYLLAMVFRHLTESSDINTGITNLMSFLASYFGLEHICLQSENKILYDTYLSQDSKSKFKPVNLNSIRTKMDNSTEIFSFNSLNQLDDPAYVDVKPVFEKQKIQASMFCNISSHQEVYGVIRAELTDKKHVWQTVEKDVFTAAAKFIGYYIYEHKTSLEEIK